MSWRLAVDIGGTFTDVVLDADGEQRTAKVLTTGNDPAVGVMDGVSQVLARSGAPLAEATSKIALVLHGTTLATNALIERRGAVTALVTTEGHRDALEMALENRFEQYDVNIDRPTPLVPRALRLPVRERLAADGSVLLPLVEETVMALLPELDSAGVESVAIGFLHAFVNPVHEQRVADLLHAARPGLAITLASAVCPEIREYERLSTATANAYVKPLMGRYLTSLEAKLAAAGLNCPMLLMTSGGGLTTLATARDFPIRLVESGPAGGAILAARLAAEHGFERVLSFDMGGTTAKLCLLDDFKPLLSRAFEVDRTYRFKKGSGLPVRIPVIEMVEIGAGGGSIASVDNLDRIHVGPESAGSKPGPACYGRGGTAATVTDADVVQGKLDPVRFAGGQLHLDVAAAEAAIGRSVGDPLGMSNSYAAFGVSEVVNENMAAAARTHALEWGRDVNDRTLIAFGGAAPLHAAQLARKLKAERVLVPVGAGVGSALGFLLAPVRYEVVRSRYMRLSEFDAGVITDVMTEMRTEAMSVVGGATASNRWQENRRAYMRYLGQGYEIAVDLHDADAIDEPALRVAFDAEYESLYGRLIPDLDVEIMSWTLTLSEAEQAPSRVREVPQRRHVKATATRPLYDADQSRFDDAAQLDRNTLLPGDIVCGPALLLEDQTTTVVPWDFEARVTALGHLLLIRREDGA